MTARHGDARRGDGRRARGGTDRVPDDTTSALTAAVLRDRDDGDATTEYVERDRCTYWLRRDRDGETPVLLATWTARIVADVIRDDGAEVSRVWDIAATVGGRPRTVRVPAREYPAMAWVADLGASAVMGPGLGCRDRMRHAIQVLSGDVPERTVYAHVGWRRLEHGRWVYLHARGAIGADGAIAGVETDPPDALARYVLPAPPEGEALRGAVQASLAMLAVAPLRITAPVYAAVGRAPLGHADMSLHLVGRTGSGKTALAALAQAHWGADMSDGHRPPASWNSTANALEALAFGAADAVLVVDDFCPSGAAADVQRAHRDADRLLRAQGNAAGRQRMRADTSLRPARPPRGMIVSTGEDVPRGESLRARLVIIEMSGRLGVDGADVDAARLGARQADAAAGRYAEAMAGYVRWLAPRMGAVRATLRRRRDALRRRAVQGAHARTPGQVADLALGLGYWLRYAVAAGALTRPEAHAVWRRCWTALQEIGDAQADHQAAADPVARYVALLGAAVASGDAHLAALDGGRPAAPESWGWRAEDGAWRAHGRRIGYVDGTSVYLVPDAAYAAAQALAARQGDSVAVTEPTLRRRLAERGMLASTGDRDGRGRLTVRRVAEGRRQEMLHLRAATLLGRDPDADADADPPDIAAPMGSLPSPGVAHVAHVPGIHWGSSDGGGPLPPSRVAHGPLEWPTEGAGRGPLTAADGPLMAAVGPTTGGVGHPPRPVAVGGVAPPGPQGPAVGGERPHRRAREEV